MKVTIFRTAMIGGGLSYDVYVETKHLENYQAHRYTTIWRDKGKRRGQFVAYPHATMPESHYSMPLGFERYDNWLDHEKNARREMLAIACKAFPELKQYSGDSLPELWIFGLMDNETSDVKTITLKDASN